MQVTQLVFMIFFYVIDICESKMKPFIVDGMIANITDFPYVAHLGTKCVDESRTYLLSWICGSSILTQSLILTAGHCASGCWEDTVITVSVGQVYKVEAGVATANSYLIHENYDDNSLSNDIALVRLQSRLNFGANIKRVALMENPPYTEQARVAGWGLINEETHEVPFILRYTNQYVWSQNDCLKLLENMPKGTICASNTKESGFASEGDSVGALVVRDYIQIGIVSGKDPEANSSVTVYTDVGYFYDWIQKNAETLMCYD